MAPAWVQQVEPLVQELKTLVGRRRRLVAVTVTVPSGVPEAVATGLVQDELARTGHPEVEVTVRPGDTFRVLAVEFSR